MRRKTMLNGYEKDDRIEAILSHYSNSERTEVMCKFDDIADDLTVYAGHLRKRAEQVEKMHEAWMFIQRGIEEDKSRKSIFSRLFRS